MEAFVYIKIGLVDFSINPITVRILINGILVLYINFYQEYANLLYKLSLSKREREELPLQDRSYQL